MDFSLSEEHLMIRDAARDFANNELKPGVIERDIEQTIPDTGTHIVLYCGGGFRSGLAADNLQKMGYTQVLSMDGGIRAWREAGYPIEASP